MKILNVIYNKGQGGLECMFLQYNYMLSELGHDVISMIPPRALIEQSIKTEKIITPYISCSTNHFNPWVVWRLRRWIKNISPDIILVQNSRPLPLLNKASKGICPVAVFHHGGSLKRLKKHADHIICTARYMVDELKKNDVAKERLHYLPNGTKIEKTYTKKPFPQKKKTYTIGTIGRFTHEKGIDIFIDSLKHLDISYKALIAGCGDLRNDLEQRAKNQNANTEFLGWIDGEEKAAFFEQCDIFVVPSRHEAFGLTIIEGWANSTPVISTMTKGGKELIDHNESGLLVETETPKAIAEAINQLIKQDNSNDLTKSAYTLLEQEYSIEATQERLECILNEITQADCKNEKNNISNVA